MIVLGIPIAGPTRKAPVHSMSINSIAIQRERVPITANIKKITSTNILSRDDLSSLIGVKNEIKLVTNTMMQIKNDSAIPTQMSNWSD